VFFQALNAPKLVSGRTRWGSLRRSPDPLVRGWGGGHPISLLSKPLPLLTKFRATLVTSTKMVTATDFQFGDHFPKVTKLRLDYYSHILYKITWWRYALTSALYFFHTVRATLMYTVSQKTHQR